MPSNKFSGLLGSRAETERFDALFQPKFDYLSGWNSNLLNSKVIRICITIRARFCFIKLET